MTKDEMLDLVIEKYGFESKYTIQFAEAMEWLGREELEVLLYETLALPFEANEEEEWD